MQNKDYHYLFECLGVLLVPQTMVTPFCRQFDNNFDKLWRGYKTFRPRLTKYCRGYVPGIPGGVDAYVSRVTGYTSARSKTDHSKPQLDLPQFFSARVTHPLEQ